jgi:hypothetical protein
MRTRYIVTLLSVGCLVCAGVAFASTAGNQRTARSGAAPLLAKLRLPAGATRSSADPAANSALNMPAIETATPARVDRHAFWRVPGAPQTAIAWIRAHPPAGSSGVFTSGVSSVHFVPYAWSVSFSFPVKPGVLRSKTLGVVVTAARGGGTAVRADAELVWTVVRPGWERVPAGVRAVTITDDRLGEPAGSPRTVTDPAQVNRIVALVNGLPRAQPGVFSCPADMGPLVGLSFLPAPGAVPVAVASADGSGCGIVTFRIGGRTAPSLSGGPGLIKSLDSLLGTQL